MSPLVFTLISVTGSLTALALGMRQGNALDRLADGAPKPKVPTKPAPGIPVRALPPPPPAPPPPKASPARVVQLDPVLIHASPTARPSAASPSKLPSKRPFGDKPLDVEADASNYASIPDHPAVLSDAAPAKAIQATPSPATRSPRQAAQELYDYVVPLIRAGRGAALGSKAEPNNIVKVAQRDMRIAADGIYGTKTRARGKELLGREFPAREGPKVAAKETPRAVAPPPPPPPPPAAAPAATLAPRDAALQLLEYVRGKSGSTLGTKTAPNGTIQRLQAAMGGISADGIYGPATRTRGKALTGQTFPART